jgi:HK97 family phage major capsid protein
MKTKNMVSKFNLNGISVNEKNDRVVMFGRALPITNDEPQYNGTRYDIKTMNVDGYKGLVTVDHENSLRSIIGKVIGLNKGDKKVTIDGIEFAIEENAEAIFAKNMLLAGYATDFSIETIGPWPNDDGVYENSELVGLSMVVVGNNKKATVNQIAYNSIEKAKELGLKTDELEAIYPLDKSKTINHTNNMQKTAEEIKAEKEALEVKAKADAEKAVKEEADRKASIEATVKNAVELLMKEINDLKEKAFDNGAKEPEFRKAAAEKIKNELSAKDYKSRASDQINYAWDFLKGGNANAAKKLEELNQFHMEQLQEKGIAPRINPVTKNAVTIADFGNFVISPELLSEIEGVRSDFAPLLSKVNFKETLSLQMAWLTRSGDISMTEVETCDDGANGNVKPISEYGASINTSNLHELAAVTPVCNAATRFLAVDLLGDVAAGYRNDFDRKKAQLLIVRLQQAINSTGNSTEFDVTSDLNSIKSLIQSIKVVMQAVPNGTFIFNNSTYWTLIEKLVGIGANGPLSNLLTTDDQPAFLGKPYIVVPDELMPSLGLNDTKTFTVEGVSVTINQGMFYVDLNTFTGRTSGGLKFDLSTEAAYEETSGQTTTVKSAFQRNELVLRGSFFRGGAVKDENKVAGLSDFAIS